MSDLFSTQDVTLYDADGNAVHVFDDAGIKRLAVDAKIGAVTISSIINDSNIFLTDIFTVTLKTEQTIRTYTVPTAKSFRLVAFQVNSNHPLGVDVMLKVDGVAKLKIYLDPSVGSETSYVYTAPVLIATAGQVVTITSLASIARGEVATMLVGIEQ